MKFQQFQNVVSVPRISRYLTAMNYDTRKAMTLYRYNLKLSQEMFTVVSCFEIALRNRIDNGLLPVLGQNWLRSSVQSNGIFVVNNNKKEFDITIRDIKGAHAKIKLNYSHEKIIAELGFGFWRYMFSKPHSRATGLNINQVLPAKPKSSKVLNINNAYIFQELKKVNDLRNRIAHHEPICFALGQSTKNTVFARDEHKRIIKLFTWMGINESELLFGIDHVNSICDKIDSL